MLTLGFCILATTIFGFVGFGALHDVRRRRTEARLMRARLALARLLLDESGRLPWADMRELEKAPSRGVLGMLQDVAVDLGDLTYQRLRLIVRASGLERRLHRLGRNRSWRRRIQAAELQPLLPDDHTDRFRLLRDPHPLVRARAAESLTRVDVIDHLENLLDMLDDSSHAVRLGAQQALLRGDARIAEALSTYLWNDSRPGTTLALEVATNLPDPRYEPVLRHHAQSTDAQRRAMVARGLGAVGSADGLPVLASLFDDPVADVRAAAASAAGATRAVDFAGPLGRLLSDPSWNVRREAGYALDKLGAPGAVMLRAQLFAEDRFARDMARQVLDGKAARQRRSPILALADLPNLEKAMDGAA